MKVEIIQEAGYQQALLGLSLSYNQPVEKMEKVAIRLCSKDSGHNKFLESIAVWIDINAPRYWWQQFDTYRIGMTKQSESTMHTILKTPLSDRNFQDKMSHMTISRLNYLIDNKKFNLLKQELPEGFLQRRIVCTNYKTLRHIIIQRQDHKLSEWQLFCEAIKEQLFCSDLLGV